MGIAEDSGSCQRGKPTYVDMGPGFSSCIALLLLALFTCGCAASAGGEPGAVNFLIESMPTNLDPRIGTDAQSERLDSLLFDGLVALDAQQNLRPDLAETWEMPDAVTYVFHLRAGVKFHDGRPLTASDVKYTFDSLLNGSIASAKRGSYAQVDSIDAPDPATVVFHLKEPYGDFLWNIAHPAIGIVPRGAGSEFSAHPIGSGPFRFVSAEQDDYVLLERNPDYFGDVPKIRSVRFRVVPEAVVRALELRKGTADLEMSSLAPDMVPVLRDQPGIGVSESPGTNYAYIAVNFDDAVLAKHAVREALARATDRKAIVEYLLRGQARIADDPLPASSWAYEPDITRYEYDPRKAEELLDSAGLPRRAPGGMRLSLTLKTSDDESARLFGEVLQEQWRKVGIDLQVRSLEFATLYADVTSGNFELYTLRWVGVNNDPYFFDFIFHSKRMPPAGANRGHYRNPALDALLDRARIEPDAEKRKELFGDIQKVVSEDLPYLSLWFQDNICVHRDRILNIQLTPSGDYDFLSRIDTR